MQTVAGDVFREAMSRVAGHVQIIATAGKAGLGGATVTAVAPVSDAPPSLLVCLNSASSTLVLIRENGIFSVNALAAEHEPVARVFSGAGGLVGPQRFRTGDGWSLSGRLPRLDHALAYAECVVTDMTLVGSHVVLIGRVEVATAGPDPAPLLYHRRGYRST